MRKVAPNQVPRTNEDNSSQMESSQLKSTIQATKVNIKSVRTIKEILAQLHKNVRDYIRKFITDGERETTSRRRARVQKQNEL